MKIKLYQIDAFSDKIFGGNPAAVCPLDTWLEDSLMQKIAAENNVAETAFFVKENGSYHLRWFTPKVEVDLCGHATLATAFVLFQILGYDQEEITFSSKSGKLTVTKDTRWICLNFPADRIHEIKVTDRLRHCFSKEILQAYKGISDYMVVLENQEEVQAVKANMNRILAYGDRGIIVTAPGNDVDFVSRFFAPGVGIPEDPVTGSAHTTLTPYWTDRLGKKDLVARQLSERGGYLRCKLLENDRVQISGQAVLFMEGEIRL